MNFTQQPHYDLSPIQNTFIHPNNHFSPRYSTSSSSSDQRTQFQMSTDSNLQQINQINHLNQQLNEYENQQIHQNNQMEMEDYSWGILASLCSDFPDIPLYENETMIGKLNNEEFREIPFIENKHLFIKRCVTIGDDGKEKIQIKIQCTRPAQTFFLCIGTSGHSTTRIGCRSKVQYTDLLALLGIALGCFEGSLTADCNLRFFGFVN